MYLYTILFIDDTTATIKADDLEEAYFLAFNSYTKQIVDIWLD